MFERKNLTKRPRFYNIYDDTFYHGPAWVIKPRLYPPKENQIKQPGPNHYHIPDRSVYTRPGQDKYIYIYILVKYLIWLLI